MPAAVVVHVLLLLHTRLWLPSAPHVSNCLLQLIARKAGGKDVDEIAAVGLTMAKVADVLHNAAAALLSAPNAQQVGSGGAMCCLVLL